jgi:hypothetical protein
MQTSIVVVDDFLDNPDELRQQALNLDYPDQQGQFPGRNSLQRIDIAGLTEAVSAIIGEPLEPAPRPQSHAKCRITLGSDEGLGRVHIDVSYWSGILFLSKPEDCRGGTEFFRHRATGTDRFPLTKEQLAATGYATFEDAQKGMVEREGMVAEAWDHLMTVPMRFNRLLLLRPWFWHTAGPGFGERLENGRLVYLMFFLKPPGNA